MLFDLLLNAILQIAFLAIVAAVFSRPVAKLSARCQYAFYVAILLFCLAVPAVNTIWRSPSAKVLLFSAAGPLRSRSARSALLDLGCTLPTSLGSSTSILGSELGAVHLGRLVLYRLARFCVAAHRIRRIRSEASVPSPSHLSTARRILGADCRVALLESDLIDDPVTVGIFHPVILLPAKVMPEIGAQELSAILAHDTGTSAGMTFWQTCSAS
ncbi:MAG: M56 family metallopeptidase [Pirellulales bacterium]